MATGEPHAVRNHVVYWEEGVWGPQGLPSKPHDSFVLILILVSLQKHDL